MSEALEARVRDLEERVQQLEKLLADPQKRPAKKRQSRTSLLEEECREADATPVPVLLNSQAFHETWREFRAYRRKLATVGTVNGKRHPWTARAATAILKKCELWGIALAIEALNISMDKEWTDIFKPEMPANFTAKVSTVSKFVA